MAEISGPGDPDGIFNAIYVQTEPGDSPTAPDSGASFIQDISWPANSSCPAGFTILTYSESSNPASPYFADQTISAANNGCQTGARRRSRPLTCSYACRTG